MNVVIVSYWLRVLLHYRYLLIPIHFFFNFVSTVVSRSDKFEKSNQMVQNNNYHRTNKNWEERQVKQWRLEHISHFRQICYSIMQECSSSSIDPFLSELPYHTASAPSTTPRYGNRQSAESRWLRPMRGSKKSGRNWKISFEFEFLIFS